MEAIYGRLINLPSLPPSFLPSLPVRLFASQRRGNSTLWASTRWEGGREGRKEGGLKGQGQHTSENGKEIA